ncbi:MAG TPA: DUF2125 domain-containing protein [Caulobacteraceae bacterium]|nr:DUF2125 domain-containing protein [Caulobacteraceae bacterium]
MTEPDTASRTQPRRLGLWIPFVLLAIALIALAGAWFYARQRLLTGLEAARTQAAGSPVSLSFGAAEVHGFPFRLDVDLTDAHAWDHSGWSLAAPRLKAEAFLFSPDHWVAYAPDGVVIGRRRAGPLVVTGKALRASLSDIGARPPRLSVEGLDLAFSTPPGAQPFFLTHAQEFHLHAKAGPEDQGAAYLEVDGAKARLSGLLARIADGKPVTFVADLIYSHAGALAGDSWPDALRDWSQAGGVANVRHLRLLAGQALIDARPGTLALGPDGRLQGALTLTLRQAEKVIGAMGAQGTLSPDTTRSALAVSGVRGGPKATLVLHFEAGRTTLGPVALGPSPRLF